MSIIRRAAARIRRWCREYSEWIDGLPPEVQAEIVRRQNQHF